MTTYRTATITSDINTSSIVNITSSNYFLLQTADLLIIEDDSGFIVLN